MVDPILVKHRMTISDKRGGWGTKEADALIEADGCWSNPKFAYVTPN